MLKARVVLDRDFAIGAIDPRLYGGFVEHLGRCVYEGIYEPDHPGADADGFRTDVMELVRELKMPVMRYPGGNFVSGYDWEDGVGPKEERPRRLDLAWRSLETNEFGTNEFVDWCRKAGTEPMICVNLGTRGLDAARSWLEYCNHPGGTRWSDLRRKHGYPEPHGVGLWCLGNEVYGNWQMGQKSAAEYGRVAREAAKLMRLTDRSVELVLCGNDQPWNARVLELAYDESDYLSIHQYFGQGKDDTPAFLARADSTGRFIEQTVATCDHVAAKLGKKRPMMIAFDEWNVWGHAPKEPRPKPADWSVAAPHAESRYTMEDALAFGGMLIQLVNHADRVKIGCLAQLVNVIAPILTAKGGPAWRQTIFYPFLHASTLGRGVALRPVVDSPTYEVGEGEQVSCLMAACVLEPESGAVTVFALNRGVEEELELTVDLRDFGELSDVEWTVLRHDDLDASNTQDAPDEVTPVGLDGAVLRDGVLSASLPPVSWNVLRLT